MSNYIKSFELFFKRIVLVVLTYQVCRLLFLYFNLKTFNDLSFNVFLGGLRFDFSVIAYTNIVFALLHLIPGNFKYASAYQNLLKVTFFSVNFLFILTNFVDFKYYDFTGRRSSYSMITAKGMENEIGGLVFSFLAEFWYLPLIAIILAVVFWKLLPDLKHPISLKKTPLKIALKQVGLCLLVLSSLAVFGRGGFQKKPLRIVDAANYGAINHSSLVLNTPFCILKTIGKNESLKKMAFYTKTELDSVYSPVLEIAPKHPRNNKNIVILILESFGRENLNIGQTPFLDSLITQSYYFKNGFANGRLSIDAVPSTLSSIPGLLNQSIITSSYSLNNVYGLPKILKDNGYYTSFFHGAFNGSQNFDQYCKVAGFDDYFGKNEYEGPESFDGKWGVFDEEFLQFFNSKLSTFQQPFFTTLFTISSHNPYTIPERYIGKFPKGTTEIQESIAYSDYALKQFFKSAQQEAWYKNTLFVITADHTSVNPSSDVFRTPVGKFRVPILFFDPSNTTLKGESQKNLQQLDIMPSVIDYLGIQAKIISYGKSYTSEEDFVVYFLDNIYHVIMGDYYLAFSGTESLALYNIKQDPLLKKNLLKELPDKTKALETFIKAYIQSFNERMIDNDLIL
ncbi:LTA synthase family protein [Mariniflexile ostreae]|uniref:LTA synthase family protein n=1 Tax=Mariniflexile ostreae TaxID=1520892 RepID=A0ABV5FEY5_9FLAO